MKNLLLAAASMAALTTLASPANALIINATTNGNSVDTSFSGPGVLAADVDFSAFAGRAASVILDVTLEAEDLGSSLDFNGVMTNGNFFENLKSFTLILDGTTFSAVGSVVPFFSLGETVLGAAGDERIDIMFGEGGEPAGVELGDVGFGGTNFGIDISNFVAGHSFSIGLIGEVPEPGVLSLLGLGALILGARQHRRLSK